MLDERKQILQKIRLRDCVQVAITFHPKSGQILVRGVPRDPEMIHFVVEEAHKFLSRNKTARKDLVDPSIKWR